MTHSALDPSPRRNALSVLILSASLVVGLTPNAWAAADTTPPVLQSLSVSPTSVDVSASAQTVTVTLRVTDDSSGAQLPSVDADSTSTSQHSGFGQTMLVSGTPQDGVYQSTITLAKNAAPGQWQVVLFPLRDNAGNSQPNFPDLSGYPSTFTVTSGAADTTPPVLQSLSVSPTSVDVSASAQTVTVTLRVTDDSSGAQLPSVDADSTSTSQHSGFGQTMLVSGTPQDGVYQSTITLAKNAAPGQWQVVLFPLRDNAGNSQPNFPDLSGYPSTFTVTSGTVASPSPILTASPTPSPTASNPPVTPRLSQSADRINVGKQSVLLTAEGTPGDAVTIYLRPHPASSFTQAGTLTLDGTGHASRSVSPRVNTDYVFGNATGHSAQGIVYVRPAEALRVAMSGRTAHFSGQIVPGHSGVLIRLYQVTSGRLVPLGNARTNNSGAWVLTKEFAAAGSKSCIAQTATDAVNLSGQSNRVTAQAT
jgi:hypothetical protein